MSKEKPEIGQICRCKGQSKYGSGQGCDGGEREKDGAAQKKTDRG